MTYRLGLVGHPVEHSLSPPMHKAALNYFGLEGDYVLIDLVPEKIEQGIANLIKDKFTGFNVTIPHKRAFLDLCSELSKDARQSGAVNTIKIDDKGRLCGHNTDIGGFMAALNQGYIELAGSPQAVILGAGGGARAALWGLTRLGFGKVAIMARNEASAEELIDNAGQEFKRLNGDFAGTKLQAVPISMAGFDAVPDLVVNATSIGLVDKEVPEWTEQLLKWMNPEGTFFDMVYSTTGDPTALASYARKLRLNMVDGSRMLVEQAILAFQYWTRQTVPQEIMRAALKEAQNKKRIARS